MSTALSVAVVVVVVGFALLSAVVKITRED